MTLEQIRATCSDLTMKNTAVQRVLNQAIHEARRYLGRRRSRLAFVLVYFTALRAVLTAPLHTCAVFNGLGLQGGWPERPWSGHRGEPAAQCDHGTYAGDHRTPLRYPLDAIARVNVKIMHVLISRPSRRSARSKC